MSGTFLSTFSGVGGIDLGLERAGWRCVGQAEADPYRRAVLAERFPTAPRWNDVRDVGRGYPEHDPYGRAHPITMGGPAEVDLLCGGFPCQDLSVAGRRAGLSGERSGLFFEFARIADALRPRWLLIENVPGLFSSNGGRDFGVLLGTLADLGYGVAWRVLDSRFFGVPQRRRRVFIVASDVGGRAGAECAGEVLAVGSGCGGHPQTGGEAGPGATADSGRGPDLAGTLVKRYGKGTDSDATDTFVVNALDRMAGGPDDNAAQAGHLVGFHLTQDLIHVLNGVPPLGHKSTGQGVHDTAGVRRLTPRECERLQGFPDDWTLIDWQGKPAPDSRRYAACGDAVTVPVARWLGERLMAAHMENLRVAA